MTDSASTPEPEAKVGQRICTRLFGGFESVKVAEVHSDHYIVSRFGGQAFDWMPKGHGHIEKLFDAENKEIYSIPPHEVHPALAGAGVVRLRDGTLGFAKDNLDG